MASGKTNIKTALAAVQAARADIDTTLAGASGETRLLEDSARRQILRVEVELREWLTNARSSFPSIDPGV